MDTASEAWRRECEARLVLSLPLLERRPYIDRVAAKRGKEAAEVLMADVREMWRKAAAEMLPR